MGSGGEGKKWVKLWVMSCGWLARLALATNPHYLTHYLP
jgi:hypothetical protein